MLIDTEEEQKEQKQKDARDKAIARQSHRCPVIKKANEILGKDSIIDTQHAIEVLIIGLEGDREAEATIMLLRRIRDISMVKHQYHE